jgi:hypothetical protein
MLESGKNTKISVALSALAFFNIYTSESDAANPKDARSVVSEASDVNFNLEQDKSFLPIYLDKFISEEKAIDNELKTLKQRCVGMEPMEVMKCFKNLKERIDNHLSNVGKLKSYYNPGKLKLLFRDQFERQIMLNDMELLETRAEKLKNIFLSLL